MWETFNTFFEGQGGLANFLQIGGAGIAIFFFVWRLSNAVLTHIQSNRHTTLSIWLNGKQYQPSSAKSLRIAVVDDRPEDYPLESLRRLGYSVVHIASLGLGDIPALLAYQCILLDINGVLIEDPKRGGLEILKRLKVPNGPYVVAVSSRGFDITMSDFFMLADQRLKKPIPQAEVEGIIESAFESRYSAIAAAHRIDMAASFGEFANRATNKALRKVIAFLDGKIDLEVVQNDLSPIVSMELIPGVLSDLKIIQRCLVKVP